MARLFFDFEIVGGRFDSQIIERAWLGDNSHPCPPQILVGLCEYGACGSSKCQRGGVSHISYWTPEERDKAPKDAASYAKENEFVSRDDDSGELAGGRAVYAIGGLLDPRNFGQNAREPVQAGTLPPLTPAGAAAAAATAPPQHVMCPSTIVKFDSLSAPPGSVEAEWNDFGNGC